MSETPNSYTPRKITFLVLLNFFTCLFAGVYLYRQGLPLGIVLISWGSAFLVTLCVMAIVIRLAKPKQ